MNEYKYKKYYEKTQQSNNSPDFFFWKFLQDKVISKKDYGSM